MMMMCVCVWRTHITHPVKYEKIMGKHKWSSILCKCEHIEIFNIIYNATNRLLWSHILIWLRLDRKILTTLLLWLSNHEIFKVTIATAATKPFKHAQLFIQMQYAMSFENYVEESSLWLIWTTLHYIVLLTNDMRCHRRLCFYIISFVLVNRIWNWYNNWLFSGL